MGLYCWSDDGGDSLTTGFLMTSQRFSLYNERLRRELEDFDVHVSGMTNGHVVQGLTCSAHRACGIQTRSGAWLGS